MKKILIGVLLAFVCAALVHVQSGLTGKWQGQTANGTPIALDVVAKGTELTGTITRNQDESSKIEKGKISKNTFTFSATLGGQEETLTGELDGDRVTIWLDRIGRERPAVLARVAAKK